MRHTPLILLALMTFIGCSKPVTVEPSRSEDKPQVRYVYVPCTQQGPTKVNVDAIPRVDDPAPKPQEAPQKSNESQDSKPTVKKETRFFLPKPEVIYYPPKRYVTRDSKPMDFMVGYNQDGSEFVYMEGEFDTDTYDLFEGFMKASKTKAKEIKINSNGGVLASAMKLGAYVKEHQWNTGVDKEMHCYSACSFVYFAGAQKTLQGKAEVGLHRPYIPSVPDTPQNIRQIKDTYITYWNYIQAPKSIYDEMMEVPRDDMFILNKKNIQYYIDVTLK